MNGQKLDESYIQHATLSKEFGDVKKVRVQPNKLFVMGDNRDNSHDSRYWGVVSRKYIKGRALLIYWSFETRSGSHIYRGLLPKLKQLGETVWYFFVRTRWERTFKLIH